MERIFLATRHNGKEVVTLYTLYAQAANEKPLDFDIYGFRIRYVPERTCEIEEKLHEPSGMSLFWCSSCKTPSEVWFSYCPHCGAKVIGSSKFEQGSSSAEVVE